MESNMRETDRNYDSRWWALVYDQWNETGGRSGRHHCELDFYRNQLRGTSGAVLEGACGTGSILLPLLADGLDMYGFDAAEPMLEVLARKAVAAGIGDADVRITRQDLVDFAYDRLFEAIIIPASSIMMLTTQQGQISCLQDVYAHLHPGGRLLLNFYVPSYPEDLLLHQDALSTEDELGTFTHPDTGRPIQVCHAKVCDFASQTETYTWIFRHGDETASVPMQARWIHTEEFRLLLRLAGFARWELYGSHALAPYVGSARMTDAYWVATKEVQKPA